MYKLLIVDDSRIIRKAIKNAFQHDSDIEDIFEAENGKLALTMLAQHQPDVITLDINMPIMDGITTLKHMMIQHPIPSVMLSSLTKEGAKITFDALRYGAVDFITKPSKLDSQHLKAQNADIVKKVKLAAKVAIGSRHYIRSQITTANRNTPSHFETIVAIGAGEGAYNSLLNIVPRLQPDWPAVYIISFYSGIAYIDVFIEYLQHYSALPVQRITQNETLQAGVCYISTGEDYITIHDDMDGAIRLVNQSAPFDTQRNSINRLMFSLADGYDQQVIGVILSGSGDDGTEGMSEIIRIGGQTIVQDPKNCLYKEMALSVLHHCKVDTIVSDKDIVHCIQQLIT